MHWIEEKEKLSNSSTNVKRIEVLLQSIQLKRKENIKQ